MFICYLDESGTVDHGTTSHFVLLGVALPVASWKLRDGEIQSILKKARLPNAEVHTAFMMRRYPEQERIPDFERLSDAARRQAVTKERKADLAKASLRGGKAVKALQRQYKSTAAYTHLSHAERRAVIEEIAARVGSWHDVTIFAEAQQKAAHAGEPDKILEHSFEQVVSRFHHFLERGGPSAIGLLVQDNNDTTNRRLTSLMREFHDGGTAFVDVPQIVETPLFVDSELTPMVQLADLCSYAVRRFFENNEQKLMDLIYPRFDWFNKRLVGVRHYTGKAACNCRVCVDHGRGP